MADVLVSTFHRGGSSMVMQVLHAGGMDCLGRGPAFEPNQLAPPSEGLKPADWLADVPGAVKLLEPHRWTSAGKVARLAIWLDRDSVIRAKSCLRFMDATGVELPGPRRRVIAAFAASYRADRPAALKSLSRLAETVWPVRFEDILRAPDAFIDQLCSHFRVGSETIARMRAVIRTSRGPGLSPALLEPSILQDWRAAHG